mmetsp:Transcript_5306/g.16654  ORF Transcript_5306/g.16654 Transcript_5306/m.16654 type:complete len:469 (-) Transcript_5306:558-1964(-)
MLRQDGDHALDRAEHRAVDHHGAQLAVLGEAALGVRRALGEGVLGLGTRALVRQIKTDGQLEVELNGRALVRPLESVVHAHVDLGAVEGAVALVELPRLAERVERLFHQRLRAVPEGIVANLGLRTGRQAERECHAKDSVHGGNQLEHAEHLLLDLRDGAVDVRVVLLEAAHACEPGERARQLVPVQHAKVGETERQLAIRPCLVFKHEAVARAVHRLERKLGVLDLEDKHVLLVLGRMPRRVPQIHVVHVGRNHLVIDAVGWQASPPVAAADERDERVVEARAVGQEEGGAGAELVEEEELLLDPDPAVVALRRLFLQRLPLLQELGVREGDAVDALQRVAVGLAEEVGGRVLLHGESLHTPRVGQVRPAAQVDERATAVGGGERAIGDLGPDRVRFKRVVRKQAERVRLGEDEALEGRLGLGKRLGLRVDRRVLVHADRFAAHVRVVEKARGGGRTMRELHSEEFL